MKRLLILISILMAVGLAAPKAQFQTPRPGSGGGSGTPTAHATSHQNGGTDEINVGGLSGTLADPQTPAAHKTAHENGGADEISVAGLSGLLADLQNAIAHALSHQNGGGDEISVTGLSGLLADAQNPIAHASRHATLGADPLALSDIYAGTSCTNQLLRVLNGLGAGTCATVTSAYVDASIALTGGKLSQFAATTSAELAGVLSDEQGSGGGFVRATSPTLTTPNLGVPSAIDLTNATHSGATAGRAYFAGASGILSGDTGFVWDNSNKRLVLASGGQTLDAAGLTTAFHIGGDSPAPGIMLLDGYGAPPTIYMRRASGTQASKTAPTNGVASFLLGGKVWDGSAWADSAFMRLSSDGDTTGSNHGGLFDIYLTPNGSTAAPTDALRVTTDALSVGMQLGTVATTGVIRIPNDQYLYSRGGTAINVKMLGVTPSNAVAIGDNARTNQIGEV